jgi:hypothetical protein
LDIDTVTIDKTHPVEKKLSEFASDKNGDLCFPEKDTTALSHRPYGAYIEKVSSCGGHLILSL